jgi:hypothetical protein
MLDPEVGAPRCHASPPALLVFELNHSTHRCMLARLNDAPVLGLSLAGAVGALGLDRRLDTSSQPADAL